MLIARYALTIETFFLKKITGVCVCPSRNVKDIEIKVTLAVASEFYGSKVREL